METKKKISFIALGCSLLVAVIMVCYYFQYVGSLVNIPIFEDISLNMTAQSFEKAFGKADEIIDEMDIAYRDSWHAEEPYSYKTGRHIYNYEQITWKGYDGTAEFEFSKGDRLENATAYLSVASKTEQMGAFSYLKQALRKDIQALPAYQSHTEESLGIFDDGIRFKVSLKDKKEELWIDLYPTDNHIPDVREASEYFIRIDQFLMFP